MDFNWMIERAWIWIGGLMCLAALIGGGVVAAVIAVWLRKLKTDGLAVVHSYEQGDSVGRVYTTTTCPNCGNIVESTISWMGGENCNESLACPHCEALRPISVS